MSSIKEVICICCPCGCHLQVDPENDYNVTGNACPNGAAYGREELTHPTRILTSTVRVEGGLYPRCPVKTAQAVPKEKMTEVMAARTASPCTPPVRTGQVVLADVCGTGVDVVGDAKSVIHTPETIRRKQKHEYKICSGAGSGNHQQPCHPVRQ